MKKDPKNSTEPLEKHNRTAYIAEYKRRTYDRIVVEYPKGYRDILKSEAGARGLSLQGLIRRAVSEYIGSPEPVKESEPGGSSGDISETNV